MTEWKMPPKAKIFEALSAVADGRIHFLGNNRAEVTSSAGDRRYIVRWSEDLSSISSNDNASHWQGYTGYPIVAVLLLLGKIDYNAETAKSLAGVAWKQLNDHFKRDYQKAVDHVLQEVDEKGGSGAAVVQEVENIYVQLAALRLKRGLGKKEK